MTSSLDPTDAESYRRRARVITAYGLISCMIGTAGLIDRSLLTTSSAVQALDGWVVIAFLLYQAIGGALAAGGVILLRPTLELAGVWALLGFVIVNGGAIVINRGPVGGGVTAASMMLVAYVLHGRIGDLHFAARRERRIVDVSVTHDKRHRGRT
jgi:hypothetical protein